MPGAAPGTIRLTYRVSTSGFVRAAAWVASRGQSPEITAGVTTSTAVTPWVPDLDMRSMEVPADQADAVIAALQSRLDVQWVERDRPVTLGSSVSADGASLGRLPDADRANQASFDPLQTYQWGLAWANAFAGWDRAQAANPSGSPVIVAVVDSGVQYTHPDLTKRMAPEANWARCDSGTCTQYISGNLYTLPWDEVGHGTHVAGIIAAETANTIGVAGISGTRQVLINPVRVFDAAAYGSSQAIASGIIWAASHGAKVINFSGASTTETNAIDNSIDYAASLGIVVIVSAGNCGDLLTYSLNGCTYQNQPSYPAAYTSTIQGSGKVIPVASLDPGGYWSPFSTMGQYVSDWGLSAPGGCVLSTYPEGQSQSGVDYSCSSQLGFLPAAGSGYAYDSGTSMAAPQVAGAAAVLWSTYPSLTRTQVRDSLLSGARSNDYTKQYPWAFGAGALDVNNSLLIIQALLPAPTVTVAPIITATFTIPATSTKSPTSTRSPTSTTTPTQTQSASPTASPSVTASPSRTATSTPSPSITATPIFGDGPGQVAGRGLPQIVAGFSYACALSTLHVASCWGANAVGQLGAGTTDTVASTPVTVVDGHAFAGISAGWGQHACALTTSGKAWCWGRNTYGELGDLSTIDRNAPVEVFDSTFVSRTFVDISAGGNHTCAVAADGSAWCWGLNSVGQIGDLSTISRSSPVAVSNSSVFRRITTGMSNTCALTTTGEAWCWGDNRAGQLGEGTTREMSRPVRVITDTKFIDVSVGGFHTCAISTAHLVYCWGSNVSGEIGDGTTTNRIAPTLIALPESAVSVSAGDGLTCVVGQSGKAWCWGYNAFGQIGDGSTTDRWSPALVSGIAKFATLATSGTHTCGIAVDGYAWCWGRNVTGEVGDGTTAPRMNPTKVRGEPFAWPTTAVSLPIVTGWNLVALEVKPPVALTAASLCSGANSSNSGSVIEVVRYQSSGWDSHPCALATNDFPIEFGVGYFVRASASTSWSYTGTRVTQMPPLSLKAGWNLIGVPTIGGSAPAVLSAVDAASGVQGTAPEIDRWNAGQWEGHVAGLPVNRFAIEAGRGYALRVTRAVSWQPASASTAQSAGVASARITSATPTPTPTPTSSPAPVVTIISTASASPTQVASPTLAQIDDNAKVAPTTMRQNSTLTVTPTPPMPVAGTTGQIAPATTTSGSSSVSTTPVP